MSSSQGARSKERRLHGYFETEMFRLELDDADLDRVVLGEDCAKWFASRLLRTGETGEPVQEDWGWVLSVTVAGQKLWFMLQRWHTTERGWHIWIEPRGLVSRILRTPSQSAAVHLRDAVEGFLADEPRVSGVRWVVNPEDLE